MDKRRLLKTMTISSVALLLLFAILIPAKATLTSNLSAGAPIDAAADFNANCAFCHGKDGRGLPKWRAKGQPDLTDPKWQKSRTDAQIADAIKNGKGKLMPAWKNKLSDEKIGAMVSRVRAFGKKK
ncbi:MAG: c-type cytochrome [Blastocatellia bacterium]|nr:c-type cytochrome [Blastocatellia bacterium]